MCYVNNVNDDDDDAMSQSKCIIWHLQTLAVQQRHGGPRLETPQRFNAVALFQVQQLDQDHRVDLQEAAVSWTSGTSGASSSTSYSGIAM